MGAKRNLVDSEEIHRGRVLDGDGTNLVYEAFVASLFITAVVL